MKIIFDSEEQKNVFMEELTGCYCPSVYYLEEHCRNFYSRYENAFEKDCKACWENCGLEIEVKDET